jgi:hypothetical protein
MTTETKLALSEEILAYYGVNNRVILSCDLDQDILAFFNFDTGNIELCDDNRIKNDKAFILSILHETKHAIEAQKIGLNNYGLKYEKTERILKSKNFDSYWDHAEEIKAETFAQRELKYWI